MNHHLGMICCQVLGIFWWLDTIKFLWMHQLNHGYVACGIIIERSFASDSGRSTRVQFKRFLVVWDPSSWISGQTRTTCRTNRAISDRNELIFSYRFTFSEATRLYFTTKSLILGLYFMYYPESTPTSATKSTRVWNLKLYACAFHDSKGLIHLKRHEYGITVTLNVTRQVSPI